MIGIHTRNLQHLYYSKKLLFWEDINFPKNQNPFYVFLTKIDSIIYNDKKLSLNSNAFFFLLYIYFI